MPATIGYLSKGHFWHKHQITIDDFQREKAHKVAASPPVNEYYQELLEILEKQPELFAKGTPHD